MKNQMKRYIKCNFKNLSLFLIITLIGICIGFVWFMFLDDVPKMEVISSIKETVNIAKSEEFESVNIIKNGIKINFILIIIFIISSFTVIPVFILSLMLFLKGVSISMYICILISVFGIFKGILASCTVCIIPNTIAILSYIFLANECYISSNKLLFRITKTSVITNIMDSLINSLKILPFLFLSVFIEQIFFRILV